MVGIVSNLTFSLGVSKSLTWTSCQEERERISRGWVKVEVLGYRGLEGIESIAQEKIYLESSNLDIMTITYKRCLENKLFII